MLTTAKEAIEAIRTVANQEAKKQLSNIEVTNFAQIVKDNGDNTYDIQIYGGDTVYPHIISKTIDKIVVVKKGMVRRAKLNFIKAMRKEYKVKERN